MIDFACSGCGQVLQVKDDWGGKRARCKKCGLAMKIPSKIEVGMESANAGPPAEADENSLTDTERRILRIGIIAAAAVVPVLLAILFLPGMFRQWSNNRAFALVEPKVREGIEIAKAHARSFDFNSANTDLVNLKDAVSVAEVSQYQSDDLNERIAATQAEVQRDKAEYSRKIGQGYILKDGQLISPNEQKAQADRQLAAQTAQTAELWRQYKQKQEADEKLAANQPVAAQSDQQAIQRQQQPSSQMNAEWRRHTRTMLDFTDILDKTLKYVAQGDGISFSALTTCTKVMDQYAENIYVADGDDAMTNDARKAQVLVVQFKQAVVCWQTANDASHTGAADPNYELKTKLLKDSLADRDEALNKATQGGKQLSDMIHSLAAQAGIRPAQ